MKEVSQNNTHGGNAVSEKGLGDDLAVFQRQVVMHQIFEEAKAVVVLRLYIHFFSAFTQS